MRKHHPQNERIKRQYFSYLEEAKRMSVASVDQVAAAIASFELCSGYKDFRQFRIQQAKAYKDRQNAMINSETGKPLAKSTIRSRLMALKAFIQWLAGQPGYKSRLNYSDAEYFNPSANDCRIATAYRERSVPTIEQIRHVVARMPARTVIERRDRGLIAFAILSGARDDAIASLSLKHIDLAQRTVFQDARDVRTKNRKTFTSTFFPGVGDEMETIVVEWIGCLADELRFGPNDPLFPSTLMGLDDNKQFTVIGLDRKHWKDAGAIRRIFRTAFEKAGLPYFNPHSFRKTLVTLGEKCCRNPEEFKAWSQNLGHDHVLTTFTSYGAVRSVRQMEILGLLRQRRPESIRLDGEPDPAMVQWVLAHLAKKNS